MEPSSKTLPHIEREIHILSTISHPNIVKMIDYEKLSDVVYILLEYCDHSLLEFIKTAIHPIKANQIRHIAREILSGLSELHSRDILHRDIKPSNILLTKGSKVKICDFGCAVYENDKIDGKFSIEGFTLWYKAPELLFGDRSYDYNVDMWAFGCILAEMLQGVPLFPGVNDIHQISKINHLIGSPTETNWPEFVNMPDYGKLGIDYVSPKNFKDVFLEAEEKEINILIKTLKYSERSSANELLEIYKGSPRVEIEFMKVNEKPTSYKSIFRIG